MRNSCNGGIIIIGSSPVRGCVCSKNQTEAIAVGIDESDKESEDSLLNKIKMHIKN